MKDSETPRLEPYVCPWWLIHTFDNPLRLFVQRPERILHEFVRAGDRCLDVGCGFGYFTIPMARLVGPLGAVTAVDLQAEMLEGVRRRAERHHVRSQIRLHQASAESLSIDGGYDFALAFWMIHEVPDQQATLAEIHGALNDEGRFLMVEPKVHVDAGSFRRTVELAQKVGFIGHSEPRIFFSRSFVMTKSTSTGR